MFIHPTTLSNKFNHKPKTTVKRILFSINRSYTIEILLTSRYGIKCRILNGATCEALPSFQNNIYSQPHQPKILTNMLWCLFNGFNH